MCILCAMPAGEQHWTDALGHAGPGAWRRRRAAGAVLDRYGLRLHGDPGATATVADRKGASRVVRGLGELWPAAEALAHTRLDPLDPDLLDRLEGA